MRGARFRDEKLCSCAGWRFNCGGAVITANTVVEMNDTGVSLVGFYRPILTLSMRVFDSRDST